MSDESDAGAMDFFQELRKEDAGYAGYAKKMGPLAEFITEYEYRKGSLGLTQAEIARRMGTRQSAISRFESMKHPPSYDFLQTLSQALGDQLFISPSAKYSLTLPYDLRDAADQAAASRGIRVQELLAQLVRESVKRENLERRGRGVLTMTVSSLPGAARCTSITALKNDSDACLDAHAGLAV